MEELSDLSINISKDQLFENLGGATKSRPSPRSERQMSEAIQTIHESTNVRGVYKIFPVHTNREFINVNGGSRLQSKRLAHVLSLCEDVAVFVLTLGTEVDCVIQENAADRLSYSMVLDAAASIAAESGAQSMEDLIEKTLSKDEGSTMRYSPGYCDWPLKDQGKIFDLLSPDVAGVRLSIECLMSPRKSVSGIIGIGPSEVVKKHIHACSKCNRIDCSYRRV